MTEPTEAQIEAAAEAVMDCAQIWKDWGMDAFVANPRDVARAAILAAERTAWRPVRLAGRERVWVCFDGEELAERPATWTGYEWQDDDGRPLIAEPTRFRPLPALAEETSP